MEHAGEDREEVAPARRGGSVRWTVIDRALAPFTADSAVALLGAAMDAPMSAPWEYHLSLVWIRAMRRPPHGATTATAASLAGLAAAAAYAAPGRPVAASRWPNDPRQLVGFTLGRQRWRVHPGDFEHPLMLLRRIVAVARAVDNEVLRAVGFTLTDLIEVTLAHGHRTVTRLAPLWPTADTDLEAGQAATVTGAEVAAVAALQARGTDEVTGLCERPERAAAALAWLTSDARRVSVRHAPSAPVFGAVLRVVGERPIGVPACLTLSALAAATAVILRRVGGRSATDHRMQAVTVAHAEAVFSKRVVDRAAALPVDEAPIIVGPRTVMMVVSALTHRGLKDAIAAATSKLGESPGGVGRGPYTKTDPIKVILFGGPLVVGFQVVQDVLLLHLEEFVEILADADGDWSTVELFLEDLGRHTGYEAVVFLDVLDVWAAWRDWGRLGPAEPDEDAAVLQVAPAERDFTWDRAVAWEPVDAILTATNMPEHLDWPITRLVPGTGADLFALADGLIGLVNVDPPVMILLHPSDVDGLGLDIDTLVGIADGLRTGLAGHPAVSDHFKLAEGTPLTIIIRLLGEPDPPDVDHCRVRVATNAERALIEVGIGPDVLEQFIGDGLAGHDILGLALHETVRRIRIERGQGAGAAVEIFQQAWRTLDPAILFTANLESVPHTTPVDTLPRTPAVRARVLHAVFDLVRQRGLRGTFVDEAAHEVCQDHLIPAIEQALHDRLSRSQRSLLWQLAIRLNATHATYNRRSQQLAHALTGPWADNWHKFARDDDRAVAVRATQLLFEFALATPPAGAQQVDALLIAELAALAELLLVTAGQDHGFRNDLHGLRVDIHRGGQIVVDSAAHTQPSDVDEDTDSQLLGIDVAAYHRALRDTQITMAARASAIGPVTTEPTAPRSPFTSKSRVPNDYRPLRDALEPSLQAVDDHLTTFWGTGLNGIAAILGVAADWPTTTDGIAATDPDNLIAEVVAWSHLPESEIRAALDVLTLTPDHLPVAGDSTYLEVERRSHRLALRPLPIVDGQVWILPWVLIASQQLYGAYLDSSRLPHPAQSLPAQVVNAMTEHRKASNNGLEGQVRTVVTELNLAHRFRFSQRELKQVGFPNPVGEIDLLIADPTTRRLWVCEIKDPIAPFSATTMRAHVRRFLRSGGYVTKLLAKAEQIAQHAALAAHACGITDSGSWRVIPLMITRRVEPAAHARQPRVTFLMPHQLAALLTDPHDPSRGPTPAARSV
ncbi:hypothetical protein ACN26Y_28765 [Micromonospora sp. WMMD558]|uniref:hypothetical protein n=1 Tax=Micromonospora sp. WMMD558 TaxID=3403462 RepID=UPI003BF5C40D